MRKFCPYCGNKTGKEDSKCRYCGRSLQADADKQEKNSGSNEDRKSPVARLKSLLYRVQDTFKGKMKNKHHRTIIAIAVGTVILAAGTFYTQGPTEYRVRMLSQEHNGAALLEMVAARTHSSFFSNVTTAAAREIISLKNQKDIDGLSEYVLDKTANIQQKKAIVIAFTDSKILVPNFFAIYDGEVQLREILQENGMAVDTDIFKKKMFSDIDNLLNICRSEPGNYDKKIEALKAYNINGFAEDKMFSNLKGIVDIYAIQRHLLENDNNEILQYLKYLQNQPDVPVLAQNSHFFKAIEVRVKQRKVASDSITELNKKIADMHVEENVQKKQAEADAAKRKINQTKHIEYFGIKYSSEGTLYASISGEGWGEILNPPSGVQSFKRYRAYVIKVGEIGNSNYYKPWMVSMYKIVDVTPELHIVEQNELAIKDIISAKKALEDKIETILPEKQEAEAQAQKLFNNVGGVLNQITGEKIFEFSKNNGHVPLFEQN